MGIVALQIKIMPENLDVDLADLRERIQEKLIKLGGKINSINEENIAFGLKALIVTIAYPEEKDTGIVESDLTGLDGVSSAQIIDYRRAFG